jgi:sugar lactone lactonase YvrE
MSTVEAAASELELVVDAGAQVGEGPVWSPTEGRLYWVDILSSAVHRYDPATGADDVFDVGQPVGAVALRRAGGLLLALRDGFGTLDPQTGAVALRTPVEADDPGTRMNDGKPDPAGRFWGGTMAFGAEPKRGAFYRLDPDWTVTRQFGDVTISNGLDWTDDGRTMYYVDSPMQAVDAFDFDLARGEISNRRHVIEIPEQTGLPDGLTLDAEGYLWLALHGAGVIHRYAPTGELDRIVHVPATQVTCCAFGGPGLTDLYITSAAHGLSAEARAEQPAAGGLFRYRPGVRGRPPNTFAG